MHMRSMPNALLSSRYAVMRRDNAALDRMAPNRCCSANWERMNSRTELHDNSLWRRFYLIAYRMERPFFLGIIRLLEGRLAYQWTCMRVTHKKRIDGLNTFVLEIVDFAAQHFRVRSLRSRLTKTFVHQDLMRPELKLAQPS